MLDDVLKFFNMTVEAQASDLILRSGHKPVMRVDGEIRFISDDIFCEEDSEALARHILNADELEVFYNTHEKDTAFVVPGAGRFRCNMLRQRRQMAFVFRHVKETVPSMTDLLLPVETIQKLALLHRGLVVVTGIAGSGKSTTLASMIDFMNDQTHRHIVTVEDPIEFIFQDKLCAITQREIGIDTLDCRMALKAAVRQTPDVILVGEMRDKETVEAALMAAETGHLVLSTLHTVNAVQTVERIISFFPPHQHEAIRMQLSLVLEGVVSQRLITRRANAGRVPAVEILIGTPTVKEMVLDGRTRELHEAVEEGHEYYGSQSFNQCLVGMVRQGVIDFDDAMTAADNPDELKLALRGITKGANRIEHVYGT